MANIATTATGTQAVQNLLNGKAMKDLFGKALGKHSELFTSSIVELVSTDPQLKTCNPALICAQALKAATLQLPINKQLGYAYIVVFKNRQKRTDANGNEVRDSHGKPIFDLVPTPTMVIGYKGLVQLAMRSGQCKYLNADKVYEGEFISRNKLTGAIDLSGERVSDTVVGYFCYYELLNGFRTTLYMSVEEMAEYAIRFSKSLYGVKKEQLIAKAGKGGNGIGWTGDFDAMALKTVTRRMLTKHGSLSVEYQYAVSDDIAADLDAGGMTEAFGNRAEAQAEVATEVVDIPAEEVVDTETGEIKPASQAAHAQESGNGGFIPFTD